MAFDKHRLENLALQYVPSPLIDVYCTYKGIVRKRERSGHLYDRYYSFFQQSADWSEAKLVSYQNKRLREIIPYCYECVPFYRELFDKTGLSSGDIRTVSDLPKLPLLDRQTVVDADTELISREFDPHKLVKYHTSGSSGSPMTLYFSPETWPAQYAFLWLRWRPGVTQKDKFACFQGQKLVAPGQKSPPFWRTNYANRQRLYSVFHLTDQNLRYYVDDLNSWQPEYIQGYPSAMYIVADYMRRADLTFRHPIKAAFSMSETVQEHHKTTIEETWSCPLWDQYGQGERVASITLYECGNYHYDMDFAITEFLTVDKTENGEVAEVVGTSLINKAWTLLRYRTGDLVVLDRDACCSCGRPGPVIKSIVGRTGDIITTPDGRKVMNVTAAIKDVQNLCEMQVVHTEPGRILARVVRSPHYCQDDERKLLTRLRETFGPAVSVDLEYVDIIKRTNGGKLKVMISEVEPCNCPKSQ
ncbi:MAG: phenylacetate--CoA ligase family protein [Planctomycetota bacterium]|jgi:phenylacetate-CoA ligase